MRQIFWWILVAVWGVGVLAATDPGERFLQAYFLIQDGDAARKQNDNSTAAAKFTAAQGILREIRSESPGWNSHIIDFRLKYCAEQLAAIGPVAAPAAAGPAVAPPTVVTTVVVQAVAPAGPRAEDEERIRRLTGELEQAHQQIRELETGRAELQGKLQAALQEVPATETNAKIEELLAQNRRLSEQLATAQQRIEDLGDQADRLQRAQERIKELEAAQATLTTQLAESQARLTAVESAGAVRVGELEQRNRELSEKLAAAQKELESARSGATATIESDEIRKLRAQLAAAVAEMERTQQELVTSYAAIGAVREELATVRAENAQLKVTYEGALAKLKEAETRIGALELAGQKDDEVILFLRKENALLKQIADRREARAARTASTTSRGFTFFQRKPAEPKPVAAAPAAPVVKESESGALVAELTANPAPGEPVLPPPPSALTPATAKAAAPARAEAPAGLEAKAEATRALLRDGQRAAQAQDYTTAEQKFTAALEVEPENVIALSNLGVVQYQQNRLEEAEQSLRRAVALAPNDGESRALLGIVYFRRGKTDEAFAELTRAIAINPRHAEAHNYLGITLSEKGWSAAAEQQIRKAIELNPQYADAHFNLAVLYANLRTPRYELARYHYQKSLDLGAAPDAKLAELLEKAGKK